MAQEVSSYLASDNLIRRSPTAILFLVTSSMSFHCLSAFAESTPTPIPTPTSKASVTSTPTGVLSEKGFLVYQAAFYGPSISSPASASQPSYDNGLAGFPIDYRSYVGLGYWLTDKISIAPYLVTDYFSKEQGVQLGDCYLRLANKSIYSGLGLNLAVDIRWGVPTSQFSRKIGLQSFFRSTQVMSFDVPGTRWNFTSITYERLNIWDANQFSLGGGPADYAGHGPPQIDLYAGPNINYRLLNVLSAGVLYEMATHHFSNTASFNFAHIDYDTDLEPNLSWDITPLINFNPWLNIPVGNRIAVDTTSIGFLFTLKVI